MSINVVTGGSGFIGSHLVEHLNKLGKRVLILDKVLPNYKLPEDVLFEQVDLSNPNWKYCGDSVDLLFHLAADPWSMVKGSSWFNGSRKAFYNNTLATYNVIEQTKPKHIIFSSTANIYGEGLKKSEDSPISLTSQYGYSKYIAEEIIRNSEIPYTIFRFGTVVGSRGRTFPNRLVWSAINGIPIQLFYDGKAKRDIIDVKDVVETITRGREFQKLRDNTYNLSIGKDITNKQMANLVAERALARGYNLGFSLSPFVAPGYIKYSTLFTGKMQRLYKWKPTQTYNEIFNSLFDYYINNPSALEPPSWETL